MARFPTHDLVSLLERSRPLALRSPRARKVVYHFAFGQHHRHPRDSLSFCGPQTQTGRFVQKINFIKSSFKNSIVNISQYPIHVSLSSRGVPKSANLLQVTGAFSFVFLKTKKENCPSYSNLITYIPSSIISGCFSTQDAISTFRT